MTKSVLIIEDDRDLARLASLHLEAEGYDVCVEHDGNAGSKRLEERTFDLLLLDLMLPGVDGLEICRNVRSREPYTPVVIITARGGESDRVLGLELGADDYLTKPLSFRELVARVRALFRRVEAMSAPRSETEPELELRRGSMLIELEKRKVSLAGDAVELTAKEFDLLLFFARRPGIVYTRSDLLNAVWGHVYDGYEHTVNTHINRLRSKMARHSSATIIETVWGVGYKFYEEGWE
jgi:two-component system OmpR family response regulator